MSPVLCDSASRLDDVSRLVDGGRLAKASKGASHPLFGSLLRATEDDRNLRDRQTLVSTEPDRLLVNGRKAVESIRQDRELLAAVRRVEE